MTTMQKQSSAALQSTIWTVTPTGTSADAANIQAALTAMAGVGEVRLKSGTYSITSPIIVPNSSIIVGHPNTALVQTMAVTGGHTNTCFSRDDVSTPLVTSAITAQAVPGARTITVPAALSISVGDTVAIVNGNQIATFVVDAYASTTMTLDRVLLYAFPNGSALYKFTQPRDIKIHGNGMSMNGTGDRYVSLVSGWRCLVEDIRVTDGTASEYFFSFDSGSRESEFRKIIVDGGSVTAIAIEGAEKCAMVDCHVQAIANDPGMLFQAAYDCEARNCSARGCTGAGLSFGFTLDAVGSRGGRVIGGSFHGNGVGLKIDGGSRDCEFIGVDCSYNTGAGILCQRASSLTPGRIRVHGARLIGNDYGMLVDYAQGVYASNIYVQGSKTNTLRTVNGGELTVHGLEAQEDGDHPSGALTVGVASYDTSVLKVLGGKVASAKAAGINCFQAYNTSRMEIANVTAKNPSANGIGFACVGGVMIVRDCATEGCSLGTYAGGLGANSTIRFEGRVDLSSATTAVTNDTLGCHNRGTVTLNGTSGVDYTFHDVKSGTDSVKLTRKTTSGTPNVTAPTWVFASGKVTVTGTIAGTADVYAIEIG